MNWRFSVQNIHTLLHNFNPNWPWTATLHVDMDMFLDTCLYKQGIYEILYRIKRVKKYVGVAIRYNCHSDFGLNLDQAIGCTEV